MSRHVLAVDLKDLTVRQQAYPNPPVAVFPKLHASLQWKELFTAHLVADFLFDQHLETIHPVFEGDEAEIREYHEENLRACDE